MAQYNYTAQQREVCGTDKPDYEGDFEVKHDSVILAAPETKTKRPRLYKVMLLNDDFTPMDFVVYVLKTTFHKTHDDAVHVMLEVHHKGAGMCGIYTREVAETKVEQVIHVARQNEHPLQCVMEKE